jgi:hypothetical protein
MHIYAHDSIHSKIRTRTLKHTHTHLHVVLVVERGERSKHFVDQDAHRPPVHALAVAFATHNLRCQVLGGATQRPRLGLDVFCEAEVGDFEVPVAA